MPTLFLVIALLLSSTLWAQVLGDSYRRIIVHYKGQETEASCSASSAATVFNAMLFPEFVFSETSLIGISQSEKWKKETSPTGDGLTLKQLSDFIQASITNLKLDRRYEVEHFYMDDPKAPGAYLKALKSFNLGLGHVIMMFDQGVYTGEGSYGHFSPVGAYDEESNKVLILDTDAVYYAPYWVTVEKAIEGMDTMDSLVPKKRGFIWVRRK